MPISTKNTNITTKPNSQAGLLCEVALGDELASMQLKECTMPSKNKGKGK